MNSTSLAFELSIPAPKFQDLLYPSGYTPINSPESTKSDSIKPLVGKPPFP